MKIVAVYNKIGKKRLFNIFTVVIVGIGSYYIIKNYEDFAVLKNLRYFEVLLLASFNVFLLCINGLFTWFLYRQFNLKLGIMESTQLAIATSFGNTFLPLRGGSGIQAVYLKKCHNFKYTYFASTLAGTYVINFFVVGLLGILTIVVIYITKGIFSFPIFLAFFILSAGMILAVKSSNLFLRLIPFGGLRDKAKMVLEGWKIISKSSGNVLIMGVITTLNFITLSVLIFLQFKFLNITKISGEPIMIWDSLFLATFLVLSVFINITPSSLGIKEILLAYAAIIITINPQDAIVTSVVDRMIGTSVLLVLGPIAMFYLKNFGKLKGLNPT